MVFFNGQHFYMGNIQWCFLRVNILVQWYFLMVNIFVWEVNQWYFLTVNIFTKNAANPHGERLLTVKNHLYYI